MAEELPHHSKYHSALLSLMSFTHREERNNVDYPKDHRFRPEELGFLTPMHIKRWLCWKVYGTPTPGPNDHPDQGRGNSMEFWKKAVSWYMPNKIAPWNALSNYGNPTRSKEVNDLVRLVRKKEVQKQGKKSQARRSMKKPKFIKAQRILESKLDFFSVNRFPTMLRYQFHMIAQCNDTCQAKLEDLMHHPDYDFALNTNI